MTLKSRLGKIEKNLSDLVRSDSKPWWEFEKWQRYLSIIDLVGKSDSKDFLTDEGKKIAHEVQLSLTVDLPCYNQHTGGQPLRKWTEAEYQEHIIGFAKTIAGNEELRPYIKDFDMLEPDMLACNTETAVGKKGRVKAIES